MGAKNFIFELGSEELPPRALLNLATALREEFIQRSGKALIECSDVEVFATPRRLALLVTGLAETQADSQSELWGPPVNAAFDDNGDPTRAAQGFARKCGVAVAQLERAVQGKAEKLVYRATVKGRPSIELLPDIIAGCLAGLPIPKRMRWGAHREEFVRPVHWVLMLLGEQVVECSILGIPASNLTYGHRFHAPQAITIDQPTAYEGLLRDSGYVIASFAKRRDQVRQAVEAEAGKAGGRAVIDEALLDEVTALVEWPVALAGRFDHDFLRVPTQALVSSMKEHQKYFHLVDANDQLLPNFITLSNIESKDPQQVIAGNERVIRPRLADAAFFFDADLKVRLDSRLDALKSIVFQNKLGSLYDKAERIADLSAAIAKLIDADDKAAARAGLLAKTDLVSLMVGEFPDLQGTMGQHYALQDGEAAAVAQGIGEHYQPAFAGDAVPASATGCCVSLADKLDTMTGMFAIGKPPSGDRDPFALRRAALGILRIILEHQLPLDVAQLVELALQQHQNVEPPADTHSAVVDFMLDRFRAWYQSEGIAMEVFNAVHARKPTEPLDFQKRIYAVNQFSKEQETAAQSLAAANKRVSNILSKEASADQTGGADSALLTEPAEKALASQLQQVAEKIEPLLGNREYAQALAHLAGLKEPVDDFFDNVMVMADDPTIRNNRIALLYQLREMFLRIADISLLQTTG